jgi:uncharacterized protein
MSSHIAEKPPSFYLSLPTNSLPAATSFFTSLGFDPIPEYSDPKTSAFRLPFPNSNICLMLHAPARFKEFMRPDTEIADANKATEAIFTVTTKSKEGVDDLLAKAEKAGGIKDPYTLPNYGGDCGMYSRSFADLDGHIWEAVTMLEGFGGGSGDCQGSQAV